MDDKAVISGGSANDLELDDLETNNNSHEATADVMLNQEASPIGRPQPPQTPQQGDLSLVVQSIREVVSCCACFNSDFGMKECANGHLLCPICFLTLRQDDHPQCPTCRAVLYPDTKRALIAQKVLSELPDPCPACGQVMLHKDLVGHKLNDCPKRRVSCGLAPLGCAWCGCAEDYRSHYAECNVRQGLRENSLEESLDNVLSRFRRREQMLRETFTCFSAIFRHLEGYELQSVCVVLSVSRVTQGRLVFKSDQFHSSQSRWTVKLAVRFEDDLVEDLTAGEVGIPEDTDDRQTAGAGADNNEQMNSSHTPSDESTQLGNESPNSTLRPRRIFRFAGAHRTRPYPDWRHTRNGNSNTNNIAVSTTTTTTVTNTTSTTTNASDLKCSQPPFGTMTITVTKENSPGIGRKSFAFIPLQIEVPDTGAQLSIRPMMSTYRFVSRGERTGAFTLYPMRWRYLTNLSELKTCRLLNMEMVVARRLIDEQAEQA
ncbi:unnamed protein product [Mesocestoides corti]|uniref:TRAF-type domain-containing protein n=1 Tax=Mesocestoides corti TaxID=53468 RepID=A0A0R3UIM9_MESCO|nr:unnamed protein product [Mesocestoides corti]